MSKDQVNAFLKSPNIAKLAVLKDDGRPYIVPLWYEWDGQNVYMRGRNRSAWIDYVRKNPLVAVLIDESIPPYRKVTIEGTAEMSGPFSGNDLIERRKKMTVGYLGEDAGLKYLEESKDQPRWMIKIIPEKMTTWKDPTEEEMKKNPKSSWHPRYYEPGTKWYQEYRTEKRRVDAEPQNP